MGRTCRRVAPARPPPLRLCRLLARCAGRNFVLDGDVAAEVADAEAAVVRLDTAASALADTEALARLLLRAECVASSRIEGLEVGGRRLLHADAARQLGEEPRDVTAAEVLNNIDAMVWGVSAVGTGGPITVDILLELHRRLLSGTRLEEHGGRYRTVQNWMGGSDCNPCAAEFVPPPPEAVAGLLKDLFAFCTGAGGGGRRTIRGASALPSRLLA